MHVAAPSLLAGPDALRFRLRAVGVDGFGAVAVVGGRADVLFAARAHGSHFGLVARNGDVGDLAPGWRIDLLGVGLEGLRIAVDRISIALGQTDRAREGVPGHGERRLPLPGPEALGRPSGQRNINR
jgi:hypothetical protein